MQAGAANLSAELFCKNYEGQDKGIQHRNHVFSILFLLMIHLFYSIVLLSMESVRTVDSLGIIQMLIPGILTHSNVNYFDND